MRSVGIALSSCLLVLTAVMGIQPAMGAHLVGARLWYAGYELGDEDLGEQPFVTAQYDFQNVTGDQGYDIGVQLGYGSGWDQDVSRLDGMVAVSYIYKFVSVGAGYHYVDLDNGDNEDWSTEYRAPELIASVSLPLSNVLFARLAGSWMPVVDWESENLDGETDGYTWDAALGAKYDRWAFAGGYRAHVFQEDEEDGFTEDNFQGFYVSATCALGE